ncbi:hypothetical protein Verru16b_01299 [Lacunisphaera limnophila]|uniref:Uncharacterized protein n=1 Tax=Lacunisphaera limnophila TaxID=1838286 RepID=A0A1D8ATL8_9BACT|nr:hypothetical protein [Lacunisphaera limnophila]AOS44238.1 hypothetical protein Verru16b_01299 [Lacunisphaera limnophila]
MIIRLEGRTREPRHAATSAASDAIVAAGGHVLDYNQFSNLAVCFTLELPPAGFARLRQSLATIGVHLPPPSPEELAAAAAPAGTEVAGSLRINFEHDEPDLRIPIPAVPG